MSWKRPVQVPISFSRRGGARLGAGRPKKKGGSVCHRERPAIGENQPVHVTLRVREDVFNLRSQRCFEAIGAALTASRGRFGFRVVNLSVQGNHLHLTGEAADNDALASAVQGLKVRIAKGLNRVMGRHGKVFAERYHARPLKTPSEIRAALAYVANNTAKHAAEYGKPLPAGYRDPYTVGYFGGRVFLPPGAAAMVEEPTSWLLRFGWERGRVLASARVSPPFRAVPPPAGRGGVRPPETLPLLAPANPPDASTPSTEAKHGRAA